MLHKFRETKSQTYSHFTPLDLPLDLYKLTQREEVFAFLRKKLSKAQNRMKETADKSRDGWHSNGTIYEDFDVKVSMWVGSEKNERVELCVR